MPFPVCFTLHAFHHELHQFFFDSHFLNLYFIFSDLRPRQAQHMRNNQNVNVIFNYYKPSPSALFLENDLHFCPCREEIFLRQLQAIICYCFLSRIPHWFLQGVPLKMRHHGRAQSSYIYQMKGCSSHTFLNPLSKLQWPLEGMRDLRCSHFKRNNFFSAWF